MNGTDVILLCCAFCAGIGGWMAAQIWKRK